MGRKDNGTIDLSIIIPCYCSGKWLNELVLAIIKEINEINIKYEIILIDDGSDDLGETWSAIQTLNKEIDNIMGIEHMKNYGQTQALITGMKNSKGKRIICMGDDFEDHPNNLIKLIDEFSDDTDLDVIFANYKDKKYNLVRSLGSKFVSLSYNIGYNKPRDVQITGFFIINSILKNAIIENKSNTMTFGPIIMTSTKRMGSINIERRQRIAGKSGYKLMGMISNTFDILINSKGTPLKLASLFGLLFMFFSFSIFSYILLQKFTYGIGVSGYASLIGAVTLFSGIQLFILGMQSEYLYRIIKETTPQNVIIRSHKEKTKDDKNEDN